MGDRQNPERDEPGDSIVTLTGLSHQEMDRRWKSVGWHLLPPTPLDPMMQVALDETLTLDVGKGLEAGLGIVILAIVLDRITQGFGRSSRKEMGND